MLFSSYSLFERESNKYFLLCSKKSIDRTFSTPCGILNPESFSSSTLIQKYSNEQTIFLYSLSIPPPSNPALSFPFENKLVHLSTRRFFARACRGEFSIEAVFLEEIRGRGTPRYPGHVIRNSRWNLSRQPARMFIQFSSEPCHRRTRTHASVPAGPSLLGLTRFSFDPAGSKRVPLPWS